MGSKTRAKFGNSDWSVVVSFDLVVLVEVNAYSSVDIDKAISITICLRKSLVVLILTFNPLRMKQLAKR